MRHNIALSLHDSSYIVDGQLSSIPLLECFWMENFVTRWLSPRCCCCFAWVEIGGVQRSLCGSYSSCGSVIPSSGNILTPELRFVCVVYAALCFLIPTVTRCRLFCGFFAQNFKSLSSCDDARDTLRGGSIHTSSSVVDSLDYYLVHHMHCGSCSWPRCVSLSRSSCCVLSSMLMWNNNHDLMSSSIHFIYLDASLAG